MSAPVRQLASDSVGALRQLVAPGWRLYPELAKSFAENAVNAFEQLICYSEAQADWETAFNASGREWKAKSAQSGLLNSGYFAPYFKNTVGRPDKDQKIIYQTCRSFSKAGYPASGSSAVNALDRALFAPLNAVTPYFDEVIDAIIETFPALEPRFFDDGAEPLMAIRILKYFPDAQAGTNPHVDKSALTCIAYTSDAPKLQSLVGCPSWHPSSELASYQCFATNDCEKSAVVFAGAALGAAGLQLVPATPHAVMPIYSDQPRYSIIAFWLLRGVDMAPFDTTVPISQVHQKLRRYSPKQPSAIV